MARVNHKKVRQLLNEKRSRISDRQFFTSRILALHFEDMAIAQTRRYQYRRRIHVSLHWDPKESFPARTDNLLIQINAGHPIVTQSRTRSERYELVCGLFAHELGHCLYTDFLSAQTHENFLRNGKWYPEPPELTDPADPAHEKALWAYALTDNSNAELLCQLAHKISNILEDGYIENRMLSQFPGKLGTCLEVLRERHWNSIPTLTQLIEQEEDNGHIFESILELMLSYVKFGRLKYGEEPRCDERVQTVFGLLPDLDRAFMHSSAKERWKTVNRILVRCWPYAQDYLETTRQHHDAAGTASTLSQALAERLQALAGSSDSGSGDSTPVPETCNVCPAANAEEREETRKEAGINNPSPASSSEEPEPPAADPTSAGCAAAGNGGPELPGAPASGKQTASPEEGGRIPYHQTDRVSEPTGGGVEHNDSYTPESYPDAAKDVERLLERMAERAACTQLENERLRELNDAAQGISYGDVHAGVSIRVNRITDVEEELVEQYDAMSAPLLTVSRQLQKSLLQQLKDQRRGGKQTGLLMGRRLDAHALCRNDGKVFYKNALPNEIPELAVGLLLDESGSMYACDRCTYARASAIILYDFCQSLHIPVMVYGHSTSGETVELYSYAEFDSIDRNDKYRMVDISARGSNRDGAALRFVAEQLSRRPEEIRLLILVSDGQPAAYGYGGSAAEEDLRGIQREYRRKGLLFLAAAIGEDKPNIERIYGDAFLDITDLHQLPVKLTAAVKRYLRAT